MSDIFETRISHLHGSALFIISLKGRLNKTNKEKVG